MASGPWNLREIELGALLPYVASHAEDYGLSIDEAVADLLVAGLTVVYGPGVWAREVHRDSFAALLISRAVRERGEVVQQLEARAAERAGPS